MLFQKEVTGKQLIELLELSMQDECQFLFEVDDKKPFPSSAIKFLEMKEKSLRVYSKTDYNISTYFFVKLIVHDRYLEKNENSSIDLIYVSSGVVPSEIHRKVAKILCVEL